MSLSKPLRDEFFRNRKRKQISLDGSVAGIEYGRPRGDYVTADPGPWGLPPKEFVGPSPQDYEPHLGVAQFPEAEYETYDPGMPHHLTPMIRDLVPEPVRPEFVPDYDDCRMTDPFLERALADAGDQVRSAEPVEADSLEDRLASLTMTDDSESLETRVAGMTPADPFQEIESAIDQQQLAADLEPTQPEPSPYVLQDGYLQAYEDQMHQMMDAYWRPEPPMQDPFKEQQQVYDEQMQQLRDSFGTMDPGPMM